MHKRALTNTINPSYHIASTSDHSCDTCMVNILHFADNVSVPTPLTAHQNVPQQTPCSHVKQNLVGFVTFQSHKPRDHNVWDSMVVYQFFSYID